MMALRQRTHVFGILLPVVLLTVGCGSGNGANSTDPQPTPTVVPYTPGTRVSWDARTRVRVEDGASYARMIRLDSGALLVGYSRRGRIYVRRSTDEGWLWEDRRLVAEEPAEGVSAANAELTQLENGTLLLTYNVRTWDNPNRRFALKVNASTDGGRTWSPRATVFEAGFTSDRGVWEPIVVQLPSGVLQLYAANEYPYDQSNDQEITMWRSTDRGHTWTDGTTISYRPGHRDGMPVPLLVDDGGVALAIEDLGLGGPFKPAIVWTPSVENAWANAPIAGDSEQRWRTLTGAARLPTQAYGGAPYLAQFPTGEVLLSFQSSAGRTTTEDHVVHSTMVVGIGTAQARAFSRLSRPFDVPPDDRAVWNSLLVKDSSTVTAITTTTAYTSTERQQLYVIDGHRVPEPTVPRGVVAVDGTGDEAVWARSTTLPAGAYAEKVVEAKAAWNSDHLFVRAYVTDAQPPASGTALDDEATLFVLALDSLTRDAPVEGAFRLRVNAAGRAQFEEGRGGTWESMEAPGVEVSVTSADAVSTPAFEGTRHVIEARIPWARLGGRPDVGAPWGLNVGVIDDDKGRTVEYVGGTSGGRPSGWLCARLTE